MTTLQIAEKVEQTKTRIVYVDCLPEGVTIGMENGIIVVGTKKEERTVAAGVLQGFN